METGKLFVQITPYKKKTNKKGLSEASSILQYITPRDSDRESARDRVG